MATPEQYPVCFYDDGSTIVIDNFVAFMEDLEFIGIECLPNEAGELVMFIHGEKKGTIKYCFTYSGAKNTPLDTPTNKFLEGTYA